MDPTQNTSNAGAPRLGVWDAVSLIVGIIIGVGIFETPATVFASAPGPWTGLLVWVLGGLFALVGAFCFAELAGSYPHSGGEYVYLTRAFGSLVGYLFAWAQLTVIRPGSIAAVAYVFALYARELFSVGSLELSEAGVIAVAAGAVVGLTLVNVLGVELGARTQNLLTIAKLLGLVALIVAGLFGGGDVRTLAPRPAAAWGWGSLATALVFVLWTYAGWHEAAYVASEVRYPRRNVPRALLLGTAAVMVIYLIVNAAYLLELGFAGAQSKTLAVDLLERAWPGYGGRVMALLIAVSALGALNGMIFTTARIYSVFGADHRLFVPLSRWSRRWGTPVRALLVQGVIALALMAGVWLTGDGSKNSFDVMVELTAAVFWCFFLAAGAALPVLRRRDPDAPRPFRVPGYPLLPLAFCAGCLYMVAGAILAFPERSLIGLGILAAGLPFYFFADWLGRPRRADGGRTPTPEPDLVAK